MTKKTHSRISAREGTQVLRNVIVHAQSHTLMRPGRNFLSIAAVQPDGALREEEALADIEAVSKAAYDNGWAQGQASVLQEAVEARRAGGYEEGLKAGRAAAEAAAEIGLKRQLEKFETLFRNLEAQTAHYLALAEDDMVAFCLEAIYQVMGEKAASPEGIKNLVLQAAAQFQSRNLAAIHLHQDDVAALKGDAGFSAWLSGFDPAGRVQLVADGNVQLGGAILRSPDGSLDARLETQLGRLRNALLAVRAQRGSRGPATVPQ